MLNKEEIKDAEINKAVIDRIPLTERNAFQSCLLKLMGAEHGKPQLQIELSENFGETISDIIDNTKGADNELIRGLIMSHKYDEAAEIVDGILKREVYN